VLWALTGGELSVTDLAEQVGKPAPSVSQHLAKLRMARLVRTRREGTTIFYSLENEHVSQLVADAVFNANTPAPGFPRTIVATPLSAVSRETATRARRLGDDAAPGRRTHP
jgi:DNA-binding transcriptional ArsR family regulator